MSAELPPEVRDYFREQGKIGFAARQRHALVCALCGRAFEGPAYQRFCSRGCKMKDYRQRKAAAAGE